MPPMPSIWMRPLPCFKKSLKPAFDGNSIIAVLYNIIDPWQVRAGQPRASLLLSFPPGQDIFSKVKLADIPSVNRILKKEYARRRAPIVEFIAVQTGSPFKILLSTILSARTKDETTTQVCSRLFRKVETIRDLEKISLPDLEKLIFPTGFYRTKARHLKALPGVLKDRFNGQIPDSIEELCELPGVGRKTANLVRAVAFNKPAVCVDVHVHRICNRLGLLKTSTPFETEMKLRCILPEKYWITWNAFLVSYGQTVCRPVSPKCGECSIFQFCSRTGVSKRFNTGRCLRSKPAPSRGKNSPADKSQRSTKKNSVY